MKKKGFLVVCILSCLSLFADQQPIDQQAPKETIPTYSNRINFNFLRFGYERIKPNAVYVGLESWSLFYYHSQKLHPVLGQAEIRMGYNLSLNSFNTLTPVCGGGYFKSFHSTLPQEIAFSFLGFRYEHIFGPVFNLGLNLERMWGISLKHKSTWGDPIDGIDIAIPFTWRITKKRNWDFRIEPFYTKWKGRNAIARYGGLRSSFGYRF